MKNKWKRYISIDRLLLIGVLIAQTFIIIQYAKDKRAEQAADISIEKAVTAESKKLPEDDVSNMQLPLPPGFEDEKIPSRESIEDIFDGMHTQMSAMMRRAQMDFDRIDHLMNMDEGWNRLIRSPSMDIKEKSDRYIISLSIPGGKAADIGISLDGRLLSITGKYEMQDTMGKSIQSYEKRILLPGPVSDENITKTLSDKGILQIHILKKDFPSGTEDDDNLGVSSRLKK